MDNHEAQRLADEYFEGHELACRFLGWHIVFRNSNPSVDSEPLMIDGIIFFIVGQDASFTFYLGLKDGQLFQIVEDEPIDLSGYRHGRRLRNFPCIIGLEPTELDNQSWSAAG